MNRVRRAAINLLYLAIGFVFLYPVLLIVFNSFKPYSAIMGNFFSLPRSIHFDKYVDTWNKLNFGKLFLNSGMYTVTVVAITILAASMAGYMLARRKTRLSAALFLLFMLPLMMPFQSIIISMTKLSKLLGLINNAPGYVLVLAGLHIPLATFMINKYMVNIPLEMDECARIDGASTLKTFFLIILPLLSPIVITVMVIDVISVWNDFFVQLLMLGGKKMLEGVQPALYAAFSNQTTDWEHSLPGLALSLVPVVVFFLFMQKQIVEGIVSGALKG